MKAKIWMQYVRDMEQADQEWTDWRMVNQGNSLLPPVALGKVPSHPVEHRGWLKYPLQASLDILAQNQFATGLGVSWTGGNVVVSIQGMSQGRGQ